MNSSNEKKCEQCGIYLNRGVSVDAVIERNGAVLLIKRGNEPFKNFWALPGGYVDWNETVEEAVAREVKEETGLTVTGTRLIGVYSLPSRHPKQVINVAFVVNADGEPVADDDAEDIKWFPLNDLPSPLAFDHGKIISDSLMLKN